MLFRSLIGTCKSRRCINRQKEQGHYGDDQCNDDDDIDCESIARRKLRNWSFDPDDVSKEANDWVDSFLARSHPAINHIYRRGSSRPMIVFSQINDLPMMKYVYEKSSNPDQEIVGADEHRLFPLYAAISKPHADADILRICKWLHAKGADARQTIGTATEVDRWSPLRRACLNGFADVAVWLGSECGALLTTATSLRFESEGEQEKKSCYEFDFGAAMRDLPSPICGGHTPDDASIMSPLRPYHIHWKIFDWAEHVLESRHVFFSLVLCEIGRAHV